MKKILLGIVAVALIGLGAYNILDKNDIAPADGKPIVKIGVIAPLSGDNAVMGQTFKDGIDFFKIRYPEKHDYEVIYKDDQLNSAKTALAANKLIKMDKVSAILTYASQPGNIVAPLIQDTGIIHVSNASDTTFTKYDNNYAFTTSYMEDANTLLEEIKRKGYRKIAMISANEAFANLVEKSIKEQVGNFDLELVFDAKFNVSTKDFRLIFRQAEEKQPDIYILQSWPPEIDILVKQLKEMDKNKPFTSMFAPFFSENLTLYEGGFYIAIDVIDSDFEKKFYEHYQREPEIMASFGYGMLETALDIVTTNKSADIDIKEIIRQNESIFGKRELKDKVISYKSVIRGFHNGKMVKIGE